MISTGPAKRLSSLQFRQIDCLSSGGGLLSVNTGIAVSAPRHEISMPRSQGLQPAPLDARISLSEQQRRTHLGQRSEQTAPENRSRSGPRTQSLLRSPRQQTGCEECRLKSNTDQGQRTCAPRERLQYTTERARPSVLVDPREALVLRLAAQPR